MICIVAGGTGGHITPALALCEELEKDKIFITGEGSRRGEREFAQHIKRAVGGEKNIFHVSVKPIVGKRLGAIGGVLSAIKSIPEAKKILERVNPDLVIGFGGYVSGPVCLAAKLIGKKVYIHEQNSVMGLTNHLLSIFADGIFLSFPNTEILPMFSKKAIFTGMPLRRKLKSDLERAEEEKKKLGKGKLTVFIVGGSQGSVALNTLFLSAIRKFRERGILPPLNIFHQTGDFSFDYVRGFYEDIGLKACVFPFTDEPGFFLGMSDFVVSRGGAVSVFEIAFARKPALFVPLQGSAGDHQFKNPATLLGDACFISRQNNATKFEVNLFELMRDDVRQKMRKRIQKIDIPNSIQKIREILKV